MATIHSVPNEALVLVLPYLSTPALGHFVQVCKRFQRIGLVFLNKLFDEKFKDAIRLIDYIWPGPRKLSLVRLGQLHYDSVSFGFSELHGISLKAFLEARPADYKIDHDIIWNVRKFGPQDK